jgi:hypothetical protein
MSEGFSEEKIEVANQQRRSYKKLLKKNIKNLKSIKNLYF